MRERSGESWLERLALLNSAKEEASGNGGLRGAGAPPGRPLARAPGQPGMAGEGVGASKPADRFSGRSARGGRSLGRRWLGWAPLLAGLAWLGCEEGGVGDPCIPEDEFFEEFSGFSLGEVNVESRSFQCETRVCLVNKFQGRVSCPYGSNGATGEGTTVDHGLACEVPGFGGRVQVPVPPWRTERRPEQAVYCSCRCDGDDPNARYCDCPSGFSCEEVVPSQGQTQGQLAGYYCIRSGSNVDQIDVPLDTCELPREGEVALCGTPPSP